MKHVTLSVIFWLLFLNLFSQAEPDRVITENNMRDLIIGKSAVVTNMDALYEGVKGTPYLTDEWKTGTILFTDDKQINEVRIKYNVYNDELEYLNNTSGKTFIVQKDKIKGFRIEESSGIKIFESFKLKSGRDEPAFAEVVYSGSVKLLVKYRKTFTAANYKGAYSSGVKYDEYKDYKEYFAVLKNVEIIRLKLTKKQILELITGKEQEIQEYINIHKPDFGKLEDIIKLLSYYDNLN